MKRTIVKIKSNIKTDEIWCEIDGCAYELMGAYSALTENIIKTFKQEGNFGESALKSLFIDTIENFKKNGINIEELK